MFLFQFRPPRRELINVVLDLFQLGTDALKTVPITLDRWIFQRRAFGVKLLLCRGDALFDGGKLAGLSIRELLPYNRWLPSTEAWPRRTSLPALNLFLAC